MQSIKEHNLKANHNYICSIIGKFFSVCNLSKNTIWKQITTWWNKDNRAIILYAIYQRTQSESKSQQKRAKDPKPVLCMQSIKEHNLKANHNSLSFLLLLRVSVCNLSKNTIWKQITTLGDDPEPDAYLYAIYQRTLPLGRDETNLKANHNLALCRWPGHSLYAIYQRTQSESKSQLLAVWQVQGLICMQSIKEHNLKANHNYARQVVAACRSVCNLSKNTIWKQITTKNGVYVWYTFCMQSIKEHNLKANHNLTSSIFEILISVCNLSKNTIWKQITTMFLGLLVTKCLYAIYQRTQSESKSQPIAHGFVHRAICMQSIKEHSR